VPRRTGKIKDIDRFDAEFFDISIDEAYQIDPLARLLLECVYETIIDAGVNPRDLYGTKTGVFVGTCYSEVEKAFFYGKPEVFPILLFNNNVITYLARNYMLPAKKILVNISSYINTYLYVHKY